MKTWIVQCLSESLSPITHMSGTAGNAAIVARKPVIANGRVVRLPFLSGNAIRHRCVREPGILWLIAEYELDGNLSLNQLNFLLHGGNLTQSNARENTARIAELHRTWPLLRLLGASLPDQILAGSMDVHRGTLVCEENRDGLIDPPSARLHSAERFIGDYQYTRGDAAKKGLAAESKDAVGKSNLMVYGGQCVDRGSLWQHGFVLKHVSEIELGALLWSLRLWQAEGGTIGGQARLGHGRLRSSIMIEDVDQKAVCDQYVDHVRRVKGDAVSWLKEAWA